MGTIEVTCTAIRHYLTPATVLIVEKVAATGAWYRGKRIVIVGIWDHLLVAVRPWPIPSDVTLRITSRLWISTATAIVMPTRRWVLAVAVGIVLRGIQTGGRLVWWLWWLLLLVMMRLRCRSVGVT